MAAFSWFRRRNLPQILTQCVRLVSPGRRLHDGGGLPGRRLQVPGRGLHGSPWGKSPEQPQVNWTELDKADALMLRKSHETGFLSWFRNGLLATGIGVIAFVQSEVGREAGYAFFILGGVCVSFGGASYVASLLSLRRLLLLSLPAVLLHCAVVSSVALFWLCAVSLYIGRLEVEIIHEEEEEEEEEDEGRDEGSECRDCRNRRDQERGGYRSHDNKGQDK